MDDVEWLEPTTLEVAEQNPSWTAAQIASWLDRTEPEYAPVSVTAVQEILDSRA